MKKVIGHAPDNIKKEIFDVLEVLQQGYIERNFAEVDQYMEKLFHTQEDVMILGTSDEEWFLNYDEAKELLSSDWQWWGDVTFNINETLVSASEDIAWLTTTGLVKYQYDNSEQTYERWLNNVIYESYFKNGEEDFNLEELDKATLKNNFLEINWLLNHKLHDWGAEKREYLSPIRFSAVLKKVDGRWIFKQMQFSFPQPFYPDMRIGNRDMQKERFEKIKAKLGEYKQKELPKSKKEIKTLLSSFQVEYLDSEGTDLNKLVERYFIQNETTTMIGTNHIKDVGLETILELIDMDRSLWDKMSLDIDEAIINEHQEIAWFATTGTIMKHLDEETALKKQYDNIKEIFQSEADSRDKLFNIRKNISMTLKEIAKGEDYQWPIKIEGVLVKDQGSWKFHYLQFSFPFYFILEGLREEFRVGVN